MKFIVNIIISSIAVLLTAFLLPGVTIEPDIVTILVTVFLLAIANSVIRPILIFFTLPLTIISLGLFALVINAMMVLLVDWFVDGFSVTNFWWALAFSIVLSIVNWALDKIGK